MSPMGDVLAGNHATWEFEPDAVLIRFERGIRTPKLFQALGERRIPYEALESVSLAPGKRGTVVLHATVRQGADPLMEAASGQLKEACDPYRLVLPAERETLAEYYADELASVLTPEAKQPSDRFLVEPPQAPLHFKAYDGKATFDGSKVAFRWFWTGASSAKWKAGDQSFAVRELAGVEWRSPNSSRAICGCCRATRTARSRPPPIRTPRPSSSASATAPCTSRCPSPPPSWGPRAVRWAPRCPPWARRCATPPPSRTGYGTSVSCTGRGW